MVFLLNKTTAKQNCVLYFSLKNLAMKIKRHQDSLYTDSATQIKFRSPQTKAMNNQINLEICELYVLKGECKYRSKESPHLSKDTFITE